MAEQIVQILFPVNVSEAFDYDIPPEMKVARGDFVFAPIGKQMKLGVVVGLKDAVKERSLKSIAQIKVTKPLSTDMLKFIDWTARYNCVSPGLVLRMVMRSYQALDPSKVVTHYLPFENPTRLTPARALILHKGGPFPARASEIAERAGVSAGVVRGMEKAGGLKAIKLPTDLPFDTPDPDFGGMALTQEQAQAGLELRAEVAKRNFSVTLLDGVTGSGKTEVYFEAVAEALLRRGVEHGEKWPKAAQN